MQTFFGTGRPSGHQKSRRVTSDAGCVWDSQVVSPTSATATHRQFGRKMFMKVISKRWKWLSKDTGSSHQAHRLGVEVEIEGPSRRRLDLRPAIVMGSETEPPRAAQG